MLLLVVTSCYKQLSVMLLLGCSPKTCLNLEEHKELVSGVEVEGGGAVMLVITWQTPTRNKQKDQDICCLYHLLLLACTYTYSCCLVGCRIAHADDSVLEEY